MVIYRGMVLVFPQMFNYDKNLTSKNNKLKIDTMERKEIYRIVDGERDYQDTIRKENENETREDNEKCLSDFILYMDHTLNKAKTAIYTLNDEEAKHMIRKVIALGVACGESFGLPERT